MLRILKSNLNKDFTNICDWFVDNKLSIHLGEGKTKFIFFTSKRKTKTSQKLDMLANNI